MDTKGTVEIKAPVITGKIKDFPIIDHTLTKDGYCADAKVVGDALSNHMQLINELRTELNELNELKGESHDAS